MNLPRRIVDLLTNPRSAWAAIAAERDDVPATYGRYIAWLAAVPAASLLIGLAAGAGRFLGVAGITTALTAAAMGYAIALASPIATAAVIEKLAPYFTSDGDLADALKLVGYASTPFWLAGICYLSAVLSPLAVLGWPWAIYLFFVGLPIVLKTPRGQVVPFTLVSILVVVVVNVVLRLFVSAFGIPHY
jgi:hypothetical protein